MTPPCTVRFTRMPPGHGERTRYRVIVTPTNGGPEWIPGVVASHRGTGRESGAYWTAYCDGDPFKVLRYADVRTRPPIAFPSRGQATDALVLHVEEKHR